MSGLETVIQELSNVPPAQVVSLIAGAVLSPAKVIALSIGVYKALSLNHVDPTWKRLADPQNDEDPRMFDAH